MRQTKTEIARKIAYISDAIEGILRALLLSGKNDIFNIASGTSCSLDEIAKIIDIKINYKDEIKEAQLKWLFNKSELTNNINIIKWPTVWLRGVV